jgi:hypothetical protein
MVITVRVVPIFRDVGPV